MRILLTVVVLASTAALGPAMAAADSCAGQPGCPYKSVVSILPQPLKLGPLAVSSDGDVFALASGSQGVIHLTPDGQIAAAWTASGRKPLGIATDARGSAVYITNSDKGDVDTFLATGAYRGSFGSGQLTTPIAIARDAANNLYVGDAAHGIQKFNSARKVIATTDAAPGGTGLALAGTGSLLLVGAAPGLPSVARYTMSLTPTDTFALPAGIGFPQVAVDSIGDIYVSDQLSDTVYQYAASGHLLTTFGGLGKTLGSFDQPSGLGIDGSDNLYASDTGNSRIQKFALIEAASTTLAQGAAGAARAARLRVHCEARGSSRCSGTLRVLHAGRPVGDGRFSLPDGATGAVRARIRRRAGRRLAHGRDIAVQVELRTRQPGGMGTRILRHRQVLRATSHQNGRLPQRKK